MSKPLITIQCGNYSNYIGSHFWNLQESGFVYQQGQSSQRDEILEIDNDVLYREGKTLNKEITFTPRLISVDLKGSLGSLPECGELYGKISIPKEESLALHWSGGHQVFREEPFVKNEFLTELNEGTENVLNEKDIDKCLDEDDMNNEKKLYNLEGSVNFWSDYLGARYHPRSILLCENFQHKNTMHPFDAWGLGRDVWTDSSNFGDQMEDRVRWYAEECDVLGGFQLVSDNHDGFGGLSAKIAELLADEYHTKPVLSFPTSPAQFPASSNTAAEVYSLFNLPSPATTNSTQFPGRSSRGGRGAERVPPPDQRRRGRGDAPGSGARLVAAPGPRARDLAAAADLQQRGQLQLQRRARPRPGHRHAPLQAQTGWVAATRGSAGYDT